MKNPFTKTAVKQLATTFTVLIIGTTALVGCSGQSSDGEATELVVWARPSSVSDEVLEAARAEFSDINIEFVPSPEIDDQLRAAIRTGTGIPDVVFLGGNLPEYFEVADKFLDIDAHGFAEHHDDFLENPLERAQLPNGKLLAMPTDIAAWAFFYNADEFEKIGLPTDPDEVSEALADWDTYKEFAETARENDKYLCDSASQVLNLQGQQQGYQWFQNDNGTIVNDFDNPINRETYDYAVEWANNGLCANVAPYTPEWNAAVTQKSLIGFIAPSYEMGILKPAAEADAGSWRTADPVGGPANAGGSFVTVMAATKNPEEAVKLAMYFSSPEQQIDAYLTKQLIPSSVAAYSDPDVTGPDDFFGGQEAFAPIAKSAENAPHVFSAPGYTAIEQALGQALTNVAVTGANPDEEFAAVEQKYKAPFGE